MLRWFEARIDPYPSAEPAMPPGRMLPFILHYLKGFKRWLAFMAVLTAAIALSEVSLFGFLGNVVDWLSKANRDTFWHDEGTRLWLMGGFVLIGLPIIIALQSMVINQTLLGNMPQRSIATCCASR